MSGTTNLDVGYVTAAQNQKEVTVNAGFDRLDKAITETFDADVTSGNVTLTSTQYREALQVRAINATTSGRTVTLPAVDRISIISNHPDNTQSVDFLRGSTTITLLAGETAWVRTDGTTNGLRVLMLGTGGGISVAFTDLTDVPASYTGEAGQLVAVNGTEDGLAFIAPSAGGVADFTDLGDVPAAYTSAAGHLVRVNSVPDALEFVAPGTVSVVTVSGTTSTPTLAQAGAFFRCTHASGCAVTIPPNSSVAYPVGTSLTYEQAAAGPVSFVEGAGVTINVAATHVAATEDQFAVAQIVQVAADEWTLFGNLEPV